MIHDASALKAKDAPAGANFLLFFLVAVAIGFAIWKPQAPLDTLHLVDWRTVGSLAGLLLIMQGIETSGVLQFASRKLLSRTTTLRQLALGMIATAAVLAALVTNDVSLFLLVPLTRVMAQHANLPLARLVVLQAMAVNAGSALTPIGNPQNLFLWHRSGDTFIGFMGMMAPTVAVMLLWLGVAVWVVVPAKAIALKTEAGTAEVQPALLALSGLLFAGFLVAMERHWLVGGLVVVFGSYLLLRPRLLLNIDWALLAIIALMFVDFRQLSDLPMVRATLGQWPITEGWRAFIAAVVTSQFISNVPAAIVLDGYVNDLPALAAGVSVGGFGLVTGSLANLIALRLAQLPHGLRDFHCISIPFLLVCTLTVLALRW